MIHFLWTILTQYSVVSVEHCITSTSSPQLHTVSGGALQVFHTPRTLLRLTALTRLLQSFIHTHTYTNAVCCIIRKIFIPKKEFFIFTDIFFLLYNYYIIFLPFFFLYPTLGVCILSLRTPYSGGHTHWSARSISCWLCIAATLTHIAPTLCIICYASQTTSVDTRTLREREHH